MDLRRPHKMVIFTAFAVKLCFILVQMLLCEAGDQIKWKIYKYKKDFAKTLKNRHSKYVLFCHFSMKKTKYSFEMRALF